ncbi:MAG: hypothetical protein FWD57_03010, partial [Polyangiaceae bacterium]|nr:hypothetical protein [Polyangiaceae bacterium]
MRLLRYVLFGAAVSMVPGCGLFKDNDPDPVPTIAPVVQPTAPVQLTTVEPPRPGEIVRPELEGRSDGITENRKSIVAGAPARATMFAPNDWTVTKTDVQMISAPDQRTRLGVANYGPEGHQAALDKSLA